MLGQPRPAGLGLWRKARLDLQQQPGRRADPARPTGGLSEAPHPRHTHTDTQTDKLSCGMRGSSEDPGWNKAGGETVMGRSQRKEENGLAISQRHCVLRWRGGTEQRWPTWERRATARDWCRSQLERTTRGNACQRQRLYPGEGKTPLKD